MSDQQLTEEIKLIERLLNEGDQKILRKSSENILILGFTGSGKSTLLAFISNRESVGIENDYGERRIDEIEEIANEKEQQVSELTIEYEMKKSQKLHYLRKKKDESLRQQRKIREDIRIKNAKDTEEFRIDLKFQLNAARKNEFYVETQQLDGCKTRINV